MTEKLNLAGLPRNNSSLVAATKPTAAQMEQLTEITDALQYSCRASLIPEDHELKQYCDQIFTPWVF